MADYKDKLDEWQQAALRKARELDDKFAISDKVEQGARAASDAAKKGVETVANGAERLRTEAERFADDPVLGETARRAANEAMRGAQKAGEAFRDVAGDAGKKAEAAFGDAKGYYKRASQFYDAGTKLTRASAATTAGIFKARDWIK